VATDHPGVLKWLTPARKKALLAVITLLTLASIGLLFGKLG
jgi:hypothetical protein